MSFGAPELLFGLLAAPLAVWGYVLLERRRDRRAARWSSPGLLPNMVQGEPGGRRHVPAVLFLLGLTLLLVGFARPEAKLKQAREGATVVIAVDISGSMNSKDVRPTRLLAARAAAVQFAAELPKKYRIAVLTFSDHLAVRLPPTYLHDEVARAIPKVAQRQATALGDGLHAAITVGKKAVGPNRPGQPHAPVAIVLFSDGNQNYGKRTVPQVTEEARKAGIPVSTVVLGTPGGIVVTRLPGGNSRQEAVPVASQDLQAIAKGSGGHFFAGASGAELKPVYQDLGSRILHERKKREITFAVTAAALVLIVAGALLSGIWFRRLV